LSTPPCRLPADMDTSSIVTEEDIQRGFAELEVHLNDGTRETVRVHLPDDPWRFAMDALHNADQLWTEWYPKLLRRDAAFLASITEMSMCQLLNVASALVIATEKLNQNRMEKLG
jgi:hypothetical protein